MTLELSPRFFRHQYGRLVAKLVRRFGVHQLGRIEDAVQQALVVALESWGRTTLPDDPAAWLYRVAVNEFLGEARQRSRRGHILERYTSDDAVEAVDVKLEGELSDDELLLLFVCCDPDIPVESQLVFALRSLCGFGVREIALRLFTSEANVYKRLGRARERLRGLPRDLDLEPQNYPERLPAVRAVLYLLFTEGYLSAHPEVAIRRELCEEALRLAEQLAAHPVGADPETAALIALMHLHLARLGARQDAAGGLLLLEEQDRQAWDAARIQLGFHWLARSADGDAFTRYHAEVGIAAEHCLASSFKETNWRRIVECYELLEAVSPSPLHRLNRALALAELSGASAALRCLEAEAPPGWLAGSYLWLAALADLCRRAGDGARADRYKREALEQAPNAAIRVLLERRLSD